MRQRQFLSTSATRVVLFLLFGSFFCTGSIMAESDRKAFREASGKYEGKFSAVLTGEFIAPPLQFVSTGHVRLPAGKGKGFVNLVPKTMLLTPPQGEKTRIPARVKIAQVRQGGNTVLYRGKTGIPIRLAPNFGTTRGSFVARVTLKNQPTIKTHTTLKNGLVQLKGPFEGRKKD